WAHSRHSCSNCSCIRTCSSSCCSSTWRSAALRLEPGSATVGRRGGEAGGDDSRSEPGPLGSAVGMTLNDFGMGGSFLASLWFLFFRFDLEMLCVAAGSASEESWLDLRGPILAMRTTYRSNCWVAELTQLELPGVVPPVLWQETGNGIGDLSGMDRSPSWQVSKDEAKRLAFPIVLETCC